MKNMYMLDVYSFLLGASAIYAGLILGLVLGKILF